MEEENQNTKELRKSIYDDYKSGHSKLMEELSIKYGISINELRDHVIFGRMQERHELRKNKKAMAQGEQ